MVTDFKHIFEEEYLSNSIFHELFTDSIRTEYSDEPPIQELNFKRIELIHKSRFMVEWENKTEEMAKSLAHTLVALEETTVYNCLQKVSKHHNKQGFKNVLESIEHHKEIILIVSTSGYYNYLQGIEGGEIERDYKNGFLQEEYFKYNNLKIPIYKLRELSQHKFIFLANKEQRGTIMSYLPSKDLRNKQNVVLERIHLEFKTFGEEVEISDELNNLLPPNIRGSDDVEAKKRYLSSHVVYLEYQDSFQYLGPISRHGLHFFDLNF